MTDDPEIRRPKPATMESYQKRLSRVQEHIFAAMARDDFRRGAAEIDLNSLADVACFSPYHFHRIYRAMQGETVAQTVRRIRLNRAASDLIGSNAPIPDVARRAGYGSAEAFARAFSASFLVSPRGYRARGVDLAARLASPNQQDSPMLDVEIQDRPAMLLFGMPHQGPYTEIGKTFERLTLWAQGKDLFGPDTKMVGVYFDDPQQTPAADLRSAACFTAPDGFEPDDAVEAVRIAAGPCAVARHVGPYAELHRAYDHLYGVWLPASGRDPADAPPYETYLNDPRVTPPGDLITEIAAPLRPVD